MNGIEDQSSGPRNQGMEGVVTTSSTAGVNEAVGETVERRGERDAGDREWSTAQKRQYMMPVTYANCIEAII